MQFPNLGIQLKSINGNSLNVVLPDDLEVMKLLVAIGGFNFCVILPKYALSKISTTLYRYFNLYTH